MQSSGVDTVLAARQVERQCRLELGTLRVARKRRTAYGTTVQLLSATSETDLSDFEQGSGGIYIGPAPKFWLDEESRKSVGQRYTCVVRGVSAGREFVEERINAALKSGVANLWAPDKFGKAEIRTYELGARLLKGDHRGFIRLLVGANRDESSRTWEAYQAFQRGDLSACAVALPPKACSITTAVIMMLNKTGDAEAAMRAVPMSLRWSLKKAVDAYVWNQVAKFRLTSMLTEHAVEGDWVLLDGGSLTRVTSREARSKKYPLSRVLLPLCPTSEVGVRLWEVSSPLSGGCSDFTCRWDWKLLHSRCSSRTSHSIVIFLFLSVEPQDYPLNAAAFAYTKARENLGLKDTHFKEAAERVRSTQLLLHRRLGPDVVVQIGRQERNGESEQQQQQPLLYRPLVGFPTEVQWDLVTGPVGQPVVATDVVRNGLIADLDPSLSTRDGLPGGRKRSPRSETCLRLRFTLEKAHDCGGRMVLREILQRPIHEFMPASSLGRQDLLF
ncbi:hypothetical protein FOZ62_005275 [Perkinsus olseni]|uniref:TRUD domain-containing protein n=1 Tax=Perkinsus olseni TaxID=32597 RepID=A0A7J6NRE1_PEROL|nr:hypothetical protein FOZ62_005275 [Perkinsus olseni]